MREVVFAMELRGKAAPVAGKEGHFRATTAGSGPGGEGVRFQSKVVASGESFDEKGTIAYGGQDRVHFETVGAGHMTSSPLSDLLWGAVMWKVVRGEGKYRGATGFITSNFTFSPSTGEVVDNQYVRLAVP